MLMLHIHFLASVVEKVNYAQKKAVAKMSDFVTVSEETFALSCIANTYDKILFTYFKNQPDDLKWDVSMPSPPNFIKMKYAEKRVDIASPNLQGWSLEGWTV